MTTLPTQLPVPSESPRDLKFNAGKIDEYVTAMGWTYTDRFGVKHYTIEGINYLAQQAMNAFGYITLEGVTFTTGATVNTPNEVLLNTADSQYYKWTGSYASGPKVVPANSTPASSGGVGPGLWLAVGDASVKAYVDAFIAALGSTEDGKGDALVAVKSVLANSAARTQHDKNADFVTLTDFVGVWDGVADDTTNFQNAINSLAASASHKNTMLIIPNNCIVRITSDVTVPYYLSIRGDSQIGIPGGYAAGDVLNAAPGIHISSTAKLICSGGNRLEDLYFIRDGMTAPEPNAAAYAGTCLKLTETKSYLIVRDCLIVGFNRALDATNVAYVKIDGVHWDCNNGFLITGSGDAPEILNTRGWPWGTITATNPVVTPDTNHQVYRSGVAYSFVDCSWPTLRNCHAYGYENGYLFSGGDTVRLEFCAHEHHTVSGTIVASNGNSFLFGGSIPQTLVSNCIAKHCKYNAFTVNVDDGCVVTIDNCRAVDYTTAAFRNIGAGSMMLYNCSTVGQGTSSTSIGVQSGASNRLTLVNGLYSSSDFRTIEANAANTVARNVYKQESSGGRTYVNTVIQHPVTATTGTSLDLRSHLDFYTVSGTATITNMKGTYIGHIVSLLCADSVTFSAGTTGDGQVRASGGSQVVAGNQVVQFVCVGTIGSSTWRQLSSPVSF